MASTITIDVLADVNNAVSGVDKVNTHLRDLNTQAGQSGQAVGGLSGHLGELGQSGAGVDTLLAKIGPLAPAFAAVGTAASLAIAGGVVVAMAAGGASVAAFAGLVRPAFSEMQEAVAKSAAGQANALAGLTPAQRKAAQATIELKDAFKAQSDAFAAPVLDAYTKGVTTLKGLLPTLTQLAAPARDALVGIFTKLDEAAKSPAFKEFLGKISEAAGPVVTVLGGLVTGVLAIGKALAPLLPPLAQLGAALLPLAPVILQLVAALIGLAVQAIVPLIPPLTALVTLFVEKMVPNIQRTIDIITLLTTKLTEFTQSPVFAQLSGVVTFNFTLIVGAVQVLVDLLEGNYKKAWDDAKATTDTAVGGIKGTVNSGFDDVGKKTGATGDQIKTGIKEAFEEMVKQAELKVTALVLAVTSIGGKVKSALIGAENYLKDAGNKIIAGLIAGIAEKFQAVKDKLNELTQQIPSWKGPASTDITLLREAGQLIMRGLVNGLSDGERGVMSQLAGTTQRIASAFDGTGGTVTASLAGFGSATLAGGAGGVGVGNIYNLTVEVPPTVNPVAVGQAIVEAISAFENAGGRRT